MSVCAGPKSNGITVQAVGWKPIAAASCDQAESLRFGAGFGGASVIEISSAGSSR